jgi:hypothetical protein
MKNITVTLDDETAKWVRVRAAEQNKSMSRFLGDLLQQHMKDRVAYQRAMEQWLSKPPYLLREPGETLPTRDEIHDRTRVR